MCDGREKTPTFCIMTDKELKKLKRPQLLEILVTQSKEIDRLRSELKKRDSQLEERRLIMERTGSVAEASLALFHVLEDAQKAADLFLENAKADAQAQADELIARARVQADALIETARAGAGEISGNDGSSGNGGDVR